MAEYLLDTNILLFALQDPGRLSAAQTNVLTNSSHVFKLSAASVLEMAMLHRKGKLMLPGPQSFRAAMAAVVADAGIQLLPVRASHAWGTITIPIQPGHNDPMDLLILAQALHEKLSLISTDSKFVWYVPHGLVLTLLWQVRASWFGVVWGCWLGLAA